MSQKQQFNAELYFANPQAWTLETRGGVKGSNLIDLGNGLYKVSTIESDYLTVFKNGNFYQDERECKYDLFMIPITTDIPFTLEDFKTGKYDVVDTVTEKVAEYVKSYPLSLLVVYESEYVRYEERFYHNLRLRPRPMTPFTHPELYEVSDNLDGTWFDIVKYYDFIENREIGSHTALMKNGSTLYYSHLRLKDQPTIITQQQADEAIKAKYGKFKIQG